MQNVHCVYKCKCKLVCFCRFTVYTEAAITHDIDLIRVLVLCLYDNSTVSRIVLSEVEESNPSIAVNVALPYVVLKCVNFVCSCC